MNAFFLFRAATVAAFLSLLVQPLGATQIFLELTSSTIGDIEGEPLVTSVGGIDVSAMIECDAYEWEIIQSVDTSTGAPSGRLQARAMKFVKNFDQATPLLIEALTQRTVVSGTFYFFNVDPDSGATVLDGTVEFDNGIIVQVRNWRPHRSDPASGPFILMDEVQIVAESMVIEEVDSRNTASVSLR